MSETTGLYLWKSRQNLLILYQNPSQKKFTTTKIPFTFGYTIIDILRNKTILDTLISY